MALDLNPHWLLLPAVSAPMPFQMALDEALLRGEIPRPMLRFYFSSEPWMSVGYSFKGHCEQSEAISDHGLLRRPFGAPRNDGKTIPVCKRITGGGKVLHGSDILFSLIALKEHDESFGSVRISYWKIHEAVKIGLEALGQAPQFYRCDENLPRGGDCFQFPIASDLGLAGKKIAGGAQKRSGKKLLHQESLQLHGAEPELLMAAVKKGFERVFSIHFQSEELEPSLFQKAEESLCHYERA